MTGIARRMSIAAIMRLVIAIPLCVVLFWGIVTTALGAQAARSRNPQLMAVFVRHPDAGTQLATSLVAAKQYDLAAVVARDAVLASPLNAKAMTALGFSLRERGQGEQATATLRQAAGLGWRNTPALAWALEDAARNDDAYRIVDIADALARRQKVGSLTRAVFFAALQEPRMQRRFVERLAKQPSWRAGFFADIRDHLPPGQFDGMEAVLREMRATAAPPTATETLTYIDRMVQLGVIDRARQYWARAFAIAPADLAGQPYDGRFIRVGSRAVDTPASVFEWRINPDLDDFAAFVTEAGGPALRVEPGIDADAVVASQTLVLSPGNHVLRTRLAGGAGATAPVGWTITCLNADRPLLRTIAGDRNDELSQIAVTVPATGCPAQILRMIGINRFDAQPVTIAAVTIR